MTAVASPPSVQSLPRWDSGKNGAENLDAMTTEEVSRIFMPQKTAPRPVNPSTQSSSIATSSTSKRGNLMTPEQLASQVNGDSTAANGEEGGWGPRKKAAKFWPNSKADSVLGLSTARGQPLNTPSSGQSAASTINSALQQSSSGMVAQPQQNGARSDHQSTQQAILALQPLTGTFDRKHILVPFFPDVQKIGRQTNQKTVPAANNGYFDSKVLSRQHAEIWAERNGKIWIRDVKSSNGTFVNGFRLSQENKESEPHELRESDTLELGIDIVSEDQKSIVHHKVSAKVELAGLYNNAANMLDMMHLDPNTGQPMLGDPTSQQLSQIRGRGGSQNSIGGLNRMAGSNNLAGGANVLGPQRQVNMWMGPITIEQVVKKLTTELKQAKQQSNELHRTGDFFTTLLSLEPGEEPPKSPPKQQAEQQQSNGVPPPAPTSHLPTFYQPPAPPPSQPLPDKPDTAAAAMADSRLHSSLKRSETERPLLPAFSPTKSGPHDSQILSLLEALKSAKQELSSQGDRMKYLETALKRERRMRESAERRAKALSGECSLENDESNDDIDDTFEPPLDSLELIEQDLPNGHLDSSDSDRSYSHLNASASMETLTDHPPSTDPIATDPAGVQTRYELLKLEFDQMKLTMETYKRKAEEAEASQRRFADLVENIRSGRPDKTAAPSGPGSVTSNDSTLIGSDTPLDDTAMLKDAKLNHNAGDEGLWSPPRKQQGQQKSLVPESNLTNGNLIKGTKLPQELETSLSRIVEAQQLIDRHVCASGNGRWSQSSPYVSMVGVVLIGVGIMTWLNGWPAPGTGGKVGE